jgi:hypothetical protein
MKTYLGNWLAAGSVLSQLSEVCVGMAVFNCVPISRKHVLEIAHGKKDLHVTNKKIKSGLDLFLLKT